MMIWMVFLGTLGLIFVMVFIVSVLVFIQTMKPEEREKRQQEQTAQERRERIEYLHGCKRDRFHTNFSADTTYDQLISFLDKLEQGIYPFSERELMDDEGNVQPYIWRTFDLYEVEDYISKRMKQACWSGIGKKRFWYEPPCFLTRFDAAERENFRNGKITVDDKLMTFAEARQYAENHIDQQIKYVYGKFAK
jgi:hypothetical protein